MMASSLEEFHRDLLQRGDQPNEDDLIFEKNEELKVMLDHCNKKIAELNFQTLDSAEDDDGLEFMYGILCYRLFLQPESNLAYAEQQGVAKLIMGCLEQQTVPEVGQYVVETIMEVCDENKVYKTFFADVPGAADIVTECIHNVRTSVTLTHDEKAEFLIKRLDLVTALAVNRQLFAKSDILQELYYVWQFAYSPTTYNKSQVQSGDEDGGLRKSMSRVFTRSATRSKTVGPVKSQRSIKRDDSVGSNKSGVSRSDSMFRKEGRKPSARFAGGSSSPSAVASAADGGASPIRSSIRRHTSKQTTTQFDKKDSGSGGGGEEHGAGSFKRSTTRKATISDKKEEVRYVDASPSGGVGAFGRSDSRKVSARKVEKEALESKKSWANERKRLASSKSMTSKTMKSGMTMTDAGLQFKTLATNVGAWLSNLGHKPGMDDELLAKAFRAIRAVMCEGFCSTILEFEIPKKLILTFSNKDVSMSAIPDMVSVIGFIAQYKGMATKFGEAGAISKLTDMTRVLYTSNEPEVSKILTNCLLAIACLTAMHKQNTEKFIDKSGPQLIVDLIMCRAWKHDIRSIDAASALICNLCYKNLDMKKAFGKKGCPEALVEVLKSYEALDTTEEDAISFKSLFMAIGNLSLHAPNLDHFLDAEIHSGYANFLDRADVAVSVDTVEDALRTMNNLVLESNQKCLDLFKACLPPLLSFLRRETFQVVHLHAYAFGIIGHLCRDRENAAFFTSNDGIDTCLILLQHIDPNLALHRNAMYALGVQTINAEFCPKLIAEGSLDLVSYVLESFLRYFKPKRAADGEMTIDSGDDWEESAEFIEEKKKYVEDPLRTKESAVTLAINALRFVRRLMINRAEAKKVFAHKDLFPKIVELMEHFSEHTILMMDGVRLILSALAAVTPKEEFDENGNPIRRGSQFGGDDPNGLDEEMHHGRAHDDDDDDAGGFAGDVGDEDILPGWTLLTPPGVRAWQELQIGEDVVYKLILILRKLVAAEKNERLLAFQRLNLGLLAYFASEKVALQAFYEPLELEELVAAALHGGEEEVKHLQNSSKSFVVAKFSDNELSPEDLDGGESTPSGADRSPISPAESIVSASPSKTPLTTRRTMNPMPSARSTPRHLPSKKTDSMTPVKGLSAQQKAKGSSSAGCASRKSGKKALPPTRFGGIGMQMVAPVQTNSCDIIDIIRRALYMYSNTNEKDIPYSVVYIMSNLLFTTTPMEAEILREREELMEEFTRYIPPKEPAGYNAKVTAITNALQAFIEDESMEEWQDECLDWNYPLELSGYNSDNYPDGVQSLEEIVKVWLRTGGKCHIIDAEGKVQVCRWRSSYDMWAFEWNVGKQEEIEYAHRFPVSRVHSVATGNCSQTLNTLHAKNKLAFLGRCLVIRVKPTNEFPSGTELLLQTSTEKSRDNYVATFKKWREAAACGFY